MDRTVEMRRAREMLSWGCAAQDVAREIGVPLSTVIRWRAGKTQAFGGPVHLLPWRPPHSKTYAYLLGVYLGDGHVTIRPAGRCWLRVFLDRKYPDIVDEVRVAIGLATLGRRIQVYERPDDGVCILQCSWKRWPEVFPQHGPGRKHERPIVLEDWQREVVEAHPEEFVRGLIHSDGCRTINRFTTKLPSGRVAEYAYPRYFFCNLSADIRALFCWACELLGVRWTQSNPRNISVSHRRSVAVLEGLVGPKR
jgi:hypothetical protein